MYCNFIEIRLILIAATCTNKVVVITHISALRAEYEKEVSNHVSGSVLTLSELYFHSLHQPGTIKSLILPPSGL